MENIVTSIAQKFMEESTLVITLLCVIIYLGWQLERNRKFTLSLLEDKHSEVEQIRTQAISMQKIVDYLIEERLDQSQHNQNIREERQ